MFCCLVQYSVALAEYAESERGVVLEGRVRRYRDADAYVDVDVAKVDVVVVVASSSFPSVVEFGSCYLVGYCDV